MIRIKRNIENTELHFGEKESDLRETETHYKPIGDCGPYISIAIDARFALCEG